MTEDAVSKNLYDKLDQLGCPIEDLESMLLPAKKEEVDQGEFEKDVENARRKKLKNNLLQQELGLKEKICGWVIKTVSRYLITVFALIITTTVIFPLFRIATYLSDHVLITLLTTTTISLIGLPTLIIKSLFPSKKVAQKKLRL